MTPECNPPHKSRGWLNPSDVFGAVYAVADVRPDDLTWQAACFAIARAMLDLPEYHASGDAA